MAAKISKIFIVSPKTAVTVFLACILSLSAGCQPSQIPVTPTSTPSLPVHTPLPTYTATSPSPTISPTPSDTPTSVPSPISVFFPLPQAVPLEAFQQPLVEEVETSQLDGGAWTTYTPPDWTEQFQQTGETPVITSIAEASDGTLWFATTGGVASGGVGVYHYDGKTWTHFRKGNGLPFDEFYSIAEAPDGAIWFGSYCCGVTRFDGKSWTTYTTENGLPSDDVRSMVFTSDGALWVSALDEEVGRSIVGHFDGKGWRYYKGQQYYTSQDSLLGIQVEPIFLLPDNILLFSSSSPYMPAKLTLFDGQHWINYPTPWTDKGKYTAGMAVAPNGDLWFATEFSEVYRLSGNTWTNYSLGSDDNMITSAAVARDGSVWLAHGGEPIGLMEKNGRLSN